MEWNVHARTKQRFLVVLAQSQIYIMYVMRHFWGSFCTLCFWDKSRREEYDYKKIRFDVSRGAICPLSGALCPDSG